MLFALPTVTSTTRARHLFIRQQTAVINSIRAYLAEFVIVAPTGRRGVEQLLEVPTVLLLKRYPITGPIPSGIRDRRRPR